MKKGKKANTVAERLAEVKLDEVKILDIMYPRELPDNSGIQYAIGKDGKPLVGSDGKPLPRGKRF